MEGNGDGSGRRYPLQWFENGRLGYHAELAGTHYAMELGLLGVQALQQRGWLPPAGAVYTPAALPDTGSAPSTHLYAAMRNGVVFGSDGSRRWRFLWSGPGFDASSGCASIMALAVADAGRTVYAGACTGALWKSADGGQTWQPWSGGDLRADDGIFLVAGAVS